jgi:DNA-nicking Smr family endonuclease
VRSVLSQSPLVAGFTNAPEEAGGWGATLVDLK